MTLLDRYEYQSGFARHYYNEGAAKTVLIVLGARGIEVPDHDCERIVRCTDLDIMRQWARRAATATSLDDVFA